MAGEPISLNDLIDYIYKDKGIAYRPNEGYFIEDDMHIRDNLFQVVSGLMYPTSRKAHSEKRHHVWHLRKKSKQNSNKNSYR